MHKHNTKVNLYGEKIFNLFYSLYGIVFGEEGPNLFVILVSLYGRYLGEPDPHEVKGHTDVMRIGGDWWGSLGVALAKVGQHNVFGIHLASNGDGLGDGAVTFGDGFGLEVVSHGGFVDEDVGVHACIDEGFAWPGVTGEDDGLATISLQDASVRSGTVFDGNGEQAQSRLTERILKERLARDKGIICDA